MKGERAKEKGQHSAGPSLFAVHKHNRIGCQIQRQNTAIH